MKKVYMLTTLLYTFRLTPQAHTGEISSQPSISDDEYVGCRLAEIPGGKGRNPSNNTHDYRFNKTLDGTSTIFAEPVNTEWWLLGLFTSNPASNSFSC